MSNLIKRKIFDNISGVNTFSIKKVRNELNSSMHAQILFLHAHLNRNKIGIFILQHMTKRGYDYEYNYYVEEW